MASNSFRLGVIGGSGIYQMNAAKVVREHAIETPFGNPSDPIIEATIGSDTVMFLPRHGKGHRYLPTEVNYRANIFALKTLGVTHILSVSAVGIMQEYIKRGDLVVPDQIYDRTKGIRASTFFGDGIVGHVAFADPFCNKMRAFVRDAAASAGGEVHFGGTYICMEGPQFSTRAESKFYRQEIGCSVIGMTAIPEAKLAREAEICYAVVALATDYDCWHEGEEDVSVQAVLEVLAANATLANRVVANLSASLPAKATTCGCHSAAKYAIMTNPSVIPETTRKRLGPLYGKYFAT